jgi:hypothetical protein
MQDNLVDILQVCVRVLAAHNEKAAPYSPDVETLRRYLGAPAPDDLAQLAYTVIMKAVGDALRDD